MQFMWFVYDFRSSGVIMIEGGAWGGQCWLQRMIRSKAVVDLTNMEMESEMAIRLLYY